VWKDGDRDRDGDGLPYFQGATLEDLTNMYCFSETVADILSSQKVRLRWNREQWQQTHGSTTILQSLNLTLTKTNLLPAYTLLHVPRSSTLRSRRPRYDHSHLVPGKATSNNSAKKQEQEQEMNHPPVKVKWPKRGRESLRDFIVEVLVAENIGAWAAPWFDTQDEWALAVVTAPWFADATDPVRLEESFDHGPIKHVAVAISKLDYYLFAPSSSSSSLRTQRK
jgi:hypothetical protein